jgi:sugar O-acyltransferase (sialic acid O-acetyltransferase NeuD family)
MSKMKNLLIIGAGGCGREAMQWAKDINNHKTTWNIKGFLDNNPDSLKKVSCDIPNLGSEDNYQIQKDDEFVCAIGSSKVRTKVIEKMIARGAVFTSLVHPTAVMADTAKLGKSVIIYPFALISDNASIGDYSIINMYSSVAHDSVLGKCCTISAHCDITGMCTLGDNVFMGTTSNMIPGSRIGNDVYICAGSTVMTKIRDSKKVLGNPAKIITF